MNFADACSVRPPPMPFTLLWPLPTVRGFDLERQPTSQLDDTLGALRPGDLAVVGRVEGRCGVGETHHVEGIGGFSAELECNSMLEGEGAEDSQVDIAEPGPDQGVARYIAIGTAGANPRI